MAWVMSSCNPDPQEPTKVLVGKGVFVLNEGTYTFANASLSFYDPEADTSANQLFYKVNGAPIGDVAQSLALINDQLYIVVNNSMSPTPASSARAITSSRSLSNSSE